MEPNDSSRSTSSSTGHEEWEKAPKGYHGLFVPKKKVPTEALKDKIDAAPKLLDPAALGLPPEAHALFLKLASEAQAQGSALGAMRFVEKNLEGLLARVRRHVTALEHAEAAAPKKIEGTP